MLKEDNKGAIELSRNPILHNRQKHIDVAFHFIHERIASNEVKVYYCPTSDMLADIMTKGLARDRFQRLGNLLNRYVHYNIVIFCYLSKRIHNTLIKWECWRNKNHVT